MTRNAPPPMICGVCHRPIEQIVTYDNGKREVLEYHHSVLVPGMTPHETVPVLLEDFLDQVSICDACGRPNPTWEFPVADFEVPIGLMPSGIFESYYSVENWYTCQPCRDDVMADRWPALALRWLEYHPDIMSVAPRQRRAYRRFLEQMHAGFRANRQGDPWLIGSR